MAQRYNTPQEGTLDWHIPINENFERLEQEVEIRDADGNRGQYEPRAGRKFLATDTLDVYLGDGSQWNQVGNLAETDSTGSTSGRALASSLAAGNVVVVGTSFEEHVSRGSTNTPVQDAIDALAGSAESGTIYLPPGKTQEQGPIEIPSSAQGVHIQGTGISTDMDGNRNCVLEITGSNPGFAVRGWGWKFASMDGFTLHGTGQSYPAMHFTMPDGDQYLTPRMFNIGRLRVSNWDAAPSGVFHYDDSHAFSCHFDTLMFARSNTGPCLDFESSSPLMLKITNMYADHGSRHPVFKSRTQAPGLVVDMCNVGGEHTGVFDLDTMTQQGFVNVGFMNWEPSIHPHSTDTVNRLNGLGFCNLPQIQIAGFGGSISMDSVVELGYNNGNNILGQIQLKGDVTVRKNLIDVTAKPEGTTWYFGPSSDIQNSAGTNTGRVRALRTAGNGNA